MVMICPNHKKCEKKYEIDCKHSIPHYVESDEAILCITTGTHCPDCLNIKEMRKIKLEEIWKLSV